jgi:hypothetical protein
MAALGPSCRFAAMRRSVGYRRQSGLSQPLQQAYSALAGSPEFSSLWLNRLHRNAPVSELGGIHSREGVHFLASLVSVGSKALPIIQIYRPDTESFTEKLRPQSGCERPLKSSYRTLAPSDGLRVVPEGHRGIGVPCELGDQPHFDPLRLQGRYEPMASAMRSYQG